MKYKVEIEVDIPDGYEVGCRNHILKKGDEYIHITSGTKYVSSADCHTVCKGRLYIKKKKLTFGELKAGDKFKQEKLLVTLIKTKNNNGECYCQDNNTVYYFRKNEKVEKVLSKL